MAVGLVMPFADTGAMNDHLAEISRAVAPGAHAVLVLDGAGWHGGHTLVVPDNISLVVLPLYSPELNPVENVWHTCGPTGSRSAFSTTTTPSSTPAATHGTASPNGPTSSPPSPPGNGHRSIRRAVGIIRGSSPGFVAQTADGIHHESGVVAGVHEQTDTTRLQDQELARLQRGAEEARFPDDLVRSGDGLVPSAARQAGPTARLQRRHNPDLPDGEGAVRHGCAVGSSTMPTRQATGFVESLLRLVGLDWAVPDFSTLCRCQKSLAVNIPYRGSQGPLHLLIDGTGIETEGEGEWQVSVAVRNVACGARYTSGSTSARWRFGVEVTGSHVGDAPMLPELLD